MLNRLLFVTSSKLLMSSNLQNKKKKLCNIKESENEKNLSRKIKRNSAQMDKIMFKFLINFQKFISPN